MERTLLNSNLQGVIGRSSNGRVDEDVAEIAVGPCCLPCRNIYSVVIDNVCLVVGLASHISNMQSKRPRQLLLDREVPAFRNPQFEVLRESCLEAYRGCKGCGLCRLVSQRSKIARGKLISTSKAVPGIIELDLLSSRWLVIHDRACIVIEREGWAEGSDIRTVVVAGVRKRPGEQAEARTEGSMRHRLGLVAEANARLPVTVGGRHQSIVEPLIPMKDLSQRSIGEHWALLACTEGSAATARGGRRRVRIPAQASADGEIRLHSILILTVDSQHPSLDAGDFACALYEFRFVAGQEVGWAVAGPVAPELVDRRRRIVGVFLCKLMLKINTGRDCVLSNGLRECIRKTVGRSSLAGRLIPARPEQAVNAKTFKVAMPRLFGHCLVFRHANRGSGRVQALASLQHIHLGPVHVQRIHCRVVDHPGMAEGFVVELARSEEHTSE